MIVSLKRSQSLCPDTPSSALCRAAQDDWYRPLYTHKCFLLRLPLCIFGRLHNTHEIIWYFISFLCWCYACAPISISASLFLCFQPSSATCCSLATQGKPRHLWFHRLSILPDDVMIFRYSAFHTPHTWLPLGADGSRDYRYLYAFMPLCIYFLTWDYFISSPLSRASLSGGRRATEPLALMISGPVGFLQRHCPRRRRTSCIISWSQP